MAGGGQTAEIAATAPAHARTKRRDFMQIFRICLLLIELKGGFEGHADRARHLHEV
jgi:hypothetical protein